MFFVPALPLVLFLLLVGLFTCFTISRVRVGYCRGNLLLRWAISSCTFLLSVRSVMEACSSRALSFVLVFSTIDILLFAASNSTDRRWSFGAQGVVQRGSIDDHIPTAELTSWYRTGLRSISYVDLDVQSQIISRTKRSE